MRVEDALRLLEPVLPRQVHEWKRSLPAVRPETRVLLERHILETARERLNPERNRILLPPPRSGRSEGQLALGRIQYPGKRLSFGLNSSELLQGLGIYGRSGSGKTNIVFALLLALERARVPFLFLDHKRTCRQLLPHLKSPTSLFTPGRGFSPFQFNLLLAPPGSSAAAHAMLAVDVLARAYTLGDGAKSLLQDLIAELRANSDSSPTINELLNALKDREYPGRASGWKATALRALQSLNSTSSIDAEPSCSDDLAARVLSENTILELDALDENAKAFLIPMLMLWLFGHGMQESSREKLRLVIIVEEAHHFLYRQEAKARESVMNQMLRQCRELGIAIVVVDQHPHLISSAALGNAYTSICLNMREPSDINRAAPLSGLNEQEKRFLNMLPVGQGIVKLQDRWTKPFLVCFPEVKVKKGAITDAALKRNTLLCGTDSAGRVRIRGSALRIRHFRPEDARVSEFALRLLRDCAAHPCDGVRARYLRLGLSMDKGQRLRQELEDAELIRCEFVPVGRTRRLVMQPSTSARRLLELRPTSGHESLKHEFWKHYYAEKLKSMGYEVEVEAPRHGGRVDVMATRNNETIGIEIETGKSDVVRNVRSCLRSPFDRILVVCTDAEAMSNVEWRLGVAGLLIRGRVTVVPREAFTAGSYETRA